MLDAVETGRKKRPRKILSYGVAGVGKTTTATRFPKSIVIDLEDGACDIDCARIPASKFGKLDDVLEAIESLKSDHEFKTLVIDSLDQLEQLIFDRACLEHNVQSIDQVGYGKGYTTAVNIWRDLLGRLDDLVRRGMMVILIGHADITRFDDPQTESYSRYQPRIDKRALGAVVDWVDECLFATYVVHTKTAAESFGKSTYRGLSDGSRIWKTEERPSHIAKNRLGMPPEIEMSWESYRDYAYPKVEESAA